MSLREKGFQWLAQGGGASGAAYGVGVAHGVQIIEKLVELLIGEYRYRFLIGRIDKGVDLVEELLPFARDVADHLTTVGTRALAPDQPCLLELVEETRDGRSFLDHPVANSKRGNSHTPRPTDDAKRVVLREAQLPRLQHARNRAPDDRRRAQKGERRLLRAGPEGTVLLDLSL